MTSPTAALDADTPRHAGPLVRLDRWLLAPAPPERLAALRIMIGGFVTVYLLATVGEFARVTRLPAEQFEPIGLATLLTGPLPPSVVWLFFGGGLGLGAAFVTGAYFRVIGPLFAVTTLLWAGYHASWGQMLHFEHLFTLHLLVIGLAPAADAWSLDAHRKRERSAQPSVRYGWPIRLAAIVTVLTYVIAAVAKLRASGLRWFDGSTLANHIAYSATRLDLLGATEPPLAGPVVGIAWLIAPLAISALLIELLAPVALFGGWLRRGWVIGALAMHAGTAATMLVWFPYHGLGFALLPLYPLERFVARTFPRFLHSAPSPP